MFSISQIRRNKIIVTRVKHFSRRARYKHVFEGEGRTSNRISQTQ